MTEEQTAELITILSRPSWDSRLKALAYVQKCLVAPKMAPQSVEKPPSKRSSAQNNALHKGFQLIADTLNDAGLDMRAVLKPSVDIPWSVESVKEYLYKPIMKLKTGKESTTELEKTSGEISEIWDIMFRFLSENHGIDYIPFPSNGGLPVLYDEQ